MRLQERNHFPSLLLAALPPRCLNRDSCVERFGRWHARRASADLSIFPAQRWRAADFTRLTPPCGGEPSSSSPRHRSERRSHSARNRTAWRPSSRVRGHALTFLRCYLAPLHLLSVRADDIIHPIQARIPSAIHTIGRRAQWIGHATQPGLFECNPCLQPPSQTVGFAVWPPYSDDYAKSKVSVVALDRSL